MYAVHACASSVRNLHALSVPCRTYHMHTNFCGMYSVDAGWIVRGAGGC